MSCIIHAPTALNIDMASEWLKLGGLLGLPTETVYGLAANAMDDRAVASIYAMKSRPQFNPLITHIAYADDADHYAVMTPLAKKLAAAFWPGPCTLVLERSANCPLSLLVSAGLDTVALRVPAHPVAHQLLKHCQLPLAAPSANRSGRVSPTEAAHVAAEFDNLTILDGGSCVVGLESSVIDARGDVPILLRPGGITEDDIAQVCGIPPLRPDQTPAELHSPGMLESHYAPNRPVRLNASAAYANEAWLTFGSKETGTLNLSPTGDLVEAAANLFAYLRILDGEPYAAIAVSPIPETGLGVAINDRLKRAATR